MVEQHKILCKKRTARIGFFAVAHGTYFKQFDGLFDKLSGYHTEVKDLVEAKEDLIDSQDKLIERLKENLYLKEQLLAKQKTIKYKGLIQKSFVNDKIKNNIK